MNEKKLSEHLIELVPLGKVRARHKQVGPYSWRVVFIAILPFRVLDYGPSFRCSQSVVFVFPTVLRQLKTITGTEETRPSSLFTMCSNSLPCQVRGWFDWWTGILRQPSRYVDKSLRVSFMRESAFFVLLQKDHKKLFRQEICGPVFSHRCKARHTDTKNKIFRIWMRNSSGCYFDGLCRYRKTCGFHDSQLPKESQRTANNQKHRGG